MVLVAVKSFMVPREKFVTVERDTDVQTAARIMRDRGIGSLFVTNGKEVIGITRIPIWSGVWSRLELIPTRHRLNR